MISGVSDENYQSLFQNLRVKRVNRLGSLPADEYAPVALGVLYGLG